MISQLFVCAGIRQFPYQG